jgi:hypothetical protein
MGRRVNPLPSNLSASMLAKILGCIEADTWEEPDMERVQGLVGISHTRYLRAALGLAIVPDRPRRGDVVVGTAPDGTVIGRYADTSTAGSTIWKWRRFPAGTSADDVHAAVPPRKLTAHAVNLHGARPHAELEPRPLPQRFTVAELSGALEQAEAHVTRLRTLLALAQEAEAAEAAAAVAKTAADEKRRALREAARGAGDTTS